LGPAINKLIPTIIISTNLWNQPQNFDNFTAIFEPSYCALDIQQTVPLEVQCTSHYLTDLFAAFLDGQMLEFGSYFYRREERNYFFFQNKAMPCQHMI
jgi:hypothetical protein